mmetsp:Transcript_8500/g.24383  ORF Transcript_8500/g.24383 Transcript_8500/m.24383 type:complete len:422 (+) Transcript_8500:58-1323(+)
MVKMDDSSDGRVPVTVVTGFLGSGKTTLLNHILTASHGKKIAVIENEFGEEGIDDKLLSCNTKFQLEEELFEMMNGCICCTVRQDLVAVLGKLADRAAQGLKLDGIVIETTGLADPAPVAQTFFVDDKVKEFARLDGIVTLVDAKHIEQHLDDSSRPEGCENEAEEQIAFADRVLLNKIDLLDGDDDALRRIEGRIRGINKLAPVIRCEKASVSIDNVLGINGFDLKRILDMDPEFLDNDGDHQHDSTVSSLSISQVGELDIDLLQEWIGNLLAKSGNDIFRMKGVLAIAHSELRFVYQGVHMLFAGDFMEPWEDDEPRESKLVFIGRNLKHDELKADFTACVVTPEQRAKKLKTLRFQVGDAVLCNVSSGAQPWRKGTVVARMYREEGMPPGMVAPYQVKLDNGQLIFAPADTETTIKKA